METPSMERVLLSGDLVISSTMLVRMLPTLVSFREVLDSARLSWLLVALPFSKRRGGLYTVLAVDR